MNRLLILPLFAFAAGCNRSGGAADAEIAQPDPVPAAEARTAGDAFPQLQVTGWVNGVPAPPGGGPKLNLIDVWAHWNPACGQTAPALVRLHAKYAPRGVAFCGLTTMGKDSVQVYSERHALPWPNGYGTPREFLRPLGASSGMTLFGYEIAPVVYLVGPDGKVIWSDKQARMRHPLDAEAWEAELDAALAAALATKP